jgi:hypothetical protein
MIDNKGLLFILIPAEFERNFIIFTLLPFGKNNESKIKLLYEQHPHIFNFKS